MRPSGWLAAATSAIALLAGCGAAQEGATPSRSPSTLLVVTGDEPMSAQDAAALEEIIEGLYTKKLRRSYPGLWVGVWDPAKGTFEGAWGTAVRGGRKATVDDVVRIGSVTKTVTAAVVLQLVAKGALDLADTVEDAATTVADAHPDTADLTVEQLLGMASGLPDYLNVPDGVIAQITEDPQRTWRADELIEAATAGGVAAAGTLGYSTTNYLVLQRVVEEITGRTLQDLIAERVAAPLGTTHFELPADEDTALPDPASHGYLNALCVAEIEADGGTARRNEDVSDWSASYGQGGGGMTATIDDLVVWGAARLGDVLIDDEALVERRRSTQDLPEGVPYGLGIIDYGDGFLGHSGEALGWQAQVVHNPGTGMTIAMATNACAGADGALFDGIRTLVPFALHPPGSSRPPAASPS